MIRPLNVRRVFYGLACPTQHYALCKNLDTLPANEDGILWGYLPSVPRAQGALIRAQAGDVVNGTIATYPVAAVSHMLLNTLRQWGW